MKIPIVDENDEVIEYKDRNETIPGDIVRITAIWITDPDGNILLQKRSMNKRNSPGKWSHGVSGTVEENESYEENAYKEAAEELGIKDIVLKPIKKVLYTSVTGRKHCYIFNLTIPKDTEIKIQKEEVDEVRWFSPEELDKAITENPQDFVHALTIFKDFLLNIK